MINIFTIVLSYIILVFSVTFIDYKLKFFKRHAIIDIEKPTDKDYFKLLLRANMLEFFMLFVGIYIGSLI